MNGRISNERMRKALSVIAAELLFVIVPVAITAFVFLSAKRGWNEIRQSPEWAFAAVILAGQTSMKLIIGSAGLNKSKMQLIGALMLMLVIVGVLVLSAVMDRDLKRIATEEWLCRLQLVLFGVTAVAFLLFGSVTHALRSSND